MPQCPGDPVAFLNAERVTVCYGGATVLHGLDLEVQQGSLVALLGASGSGKTTLLRAIAGFTPVSSGKVLLDSRDITAEPPERRRMAMVFQSYALWPHMTVAQNIGYGLRLRRMSRAGIAAKVAAMLELLGLQGLAERNVTQLSGGQRQRVALGRALAIDPEVLLLDEPLSNLDAGIRVSLRQEIRALQRRVGITAVHVTHDREEAMVIADRIVVLRDGIVAQHGTPHEVYHHPNSPFVASFMGADNVVRLVARVVEGGLMVRSGGAESLLPMGDGGVHLVGSTDEGSFDAHFRAAAARLLPADGPVPGGVLGLPGRVATASYPGDVWRYIVDAAGQRFLIDDATGFSEGASVRVAIPGSALHLFRAGEHAPRQPCNGR
jgi:putative spermidine/putrescine transport system ATP-binding protein